MWKPQILCLGARPPNAGAPCPVRKTSALRGGGSTASAPGTQLPRGAPRAGLLRGAGLLGHLADHVVEDAPVVEISELHVGVKPHDSLEGLPSVQLQRQRREE